MSCLAATLLRLIASSILEKEVFVASVRHSISTTSLKLFAAASLVLIMGAGARADMAAVLGMERAALAESCQKLEFLGGFAKEVDVNGDALPDVLTDYGLLKCDGTQMMFCGSAGCTQNLYVQRDGGSYDKVAEFLAYDLRFDRPSQAAFLAVLHGGSCGRSGAETCYRRYRLAGKAVQNLYEEPRDRWFFAAEPVPLAMFEAASGDGLRFVCDGTSVRIHYAPTWMRNEDGSVSDHARDLAKPQGGRIKIEIEVDSGQPVRVPFSIDDETRSLLSPALATEQAIFAGLMRGRTSVFHLGGSLEHLRSFPLNGSSKAVGALLRNCN